MLRKVCISLLLIGLSNSSQLTALAQLGSTSSATSDWKAKVAQYMPLLGHRNWILIVDSAYPLQSSPGIETMETGAALPEIVQSVLAIVNKTPHVRPDIFMDAELPFVPDTDVPGATAYRAQIAQLLSRYKIESMPHDKVIAEIDRSSKTFKVLVLKTNMTIPYSSVFLRLNCRYWSDEAEARMRAKMALQTK